MTDTHLEESLLPAADGSTCADAAHCEAAADDVAHCGAAAGDAAADACALSAPERISKLLASMGSQRRVLLAAIRFCGKPEPAAAVNAMIAELQEHNRSVFSPANICELLEEAGALQKCGADGSALGDVQSEPETVVEDGVEYLKGAEPVEVFWQATDAGLEAASADDPLRRIEALFGEDERYTPVYRRILQICSAEGGAALADISGEVDQDPLLQEPKFYATRFIEKLEACDAISWQQRWVVTEVGEAALAMLDGRGGEAAVDNGALAELCAQRSATYSLLARLFRVEIDEPLLAELREMKFPASVGDASMDEGHRLIAKFASNVWENSLTILAVDYARTFLGHGIDAFSAAYPYESVYTSKKRLLMQEARDEVLAIYREAGINKQASWKDGEDHIALELEFMQILSDRTREALAAEDDEGALELFSQQKSFLSEHLLAWAPMMTADMRRFAETDLYQGLASLTDGFLRMDAVFLSEILAEDGDGTGGGKADAE